MPRDKFEIVRAPKTKPPKDLILHIKLILRLMADRRVNFFLKLLPVGAVIYLLLPADLVPGLTLPVIGALDDAAVLGFGMTLFVALCPDEVVQEHRDRLQQVMPGRWQEGQDQATMPMESQEPGKIEAISPGAEEMPKQE